MDKFMDLIPPHLDLSVLVEEIVKREEKLFNLIAFGDASFTDPRIHQAMESLSALYRMKEAVRQIELRYNDYVRDLVKEVKYIASQIDKL